MRGLAAASSGKVLGLLTAPAGMNANLAALSDGEDGELPAIAESQMAAGNAAIDLAERSGEVKYPAVQVYCERITNKQKEKFRAFSGTLELAIEVRVSQDRLEGIEGKLQGYAEAVAQVLEQNRGDWGEGMFYTGGYEIAFGPVKRGGKNFAQVAKVKFEVEASRS